MRDNRWGFAAWICLFIFGFGGIWLLNDIRQSDDPILGGVDKPTPYYYYRTNLSPGEIFYLCGEGSRECGPSIMYVGVDEGELVFARIYETDTWLGTDIDVVTPYIHIPYTKNMNITVAGYSLNYITASNDESLRFTYLDVDPYKETDLKIRGVI